MVSHGTDLDPDVEIGITRVMMYRRIANKKNATSDLMDNCIQIYKQKESPGTFQGDMNLQWKKLGGPFIAKQRMGA